MSEPLFREKSVEKLSSPEQLTDYIRVSNPGIWMVLAAIVIFLIGVCVWGFFGKMDTKLTVAAVCEGGNAVCYVKEDDIASLKEGMKARCDGQEGTLGVIPGAPVAVDEGVPEYALHVGNLECGEWVYLVPLNGLVGVSEDGIYPAEITINSVAPMSFVVD